MAARRAAPRLGSVFAVSVALAAPGAAADPVTRGQSPPPGPGEAAPASFPRGTLDIDMNLYAIGTPTASARNREGFSGFLFGHFNPGLHLTPDFSLQAFAHPDPAGGVEPNGAITFLRRQNVILEQLFAEWRPAEGVQLYAGKFNAPFGYGFEEFPGLMTAFRAHDVYLIREQLGAGANWTLPLPATAGRHTVSAAIFTLDTSLLSNSLITRQRCCDPGFDRYVRNTLSQGGSGNNGQLSNVAVSMEGHAIPALPGLTYNIGTVSLGRGKDATRREWGWAAGLRYQHAWSETVSTQVFSEFVEFRNAGGDAMEPTDAGGSAITRARRRFSTLGVQITSGPWRATLAWQRDAYKRSIQTLPTQNWLEASVGRELGSGFSLDAGYQYGSYIADDRSLGHTQSIIARLNYRFSH